LAIIMDGNGRWAKSRLLTRIFGHEKGIDTVRDISVHCSQLGIKFLTLYAFSEENWQRPQTEISALMHMLKTFLVRDRPLFFQHQIQLRSIGRTEKLPPDALSVLQETESLTRAHAGMRLTLALSYGGRTEMLDAIRRAGHDIRAGTLDPDTLNENTLRTYLYAPDLPDPDLMIRTSGEQRTSNFLTWQSAYTELYFTPTLWPDFSPQELDKALSNFKHRERRFGLTSEQVRKHIQQNFSTQAGS